MNAARRKELVKASSLLAEALSIVSTVLEDEENTLEAIPEAFVDKYEKCQSVVDNLGELEEQLREADNMFATIETP